MKKICLYGMTGLAFVIACTAQTTPTATRTDVKAAVAGAVDDTIRGSGTAGVVPLFTAPRTLGNSVIVQSPSGAIGIGGAPTGSAKLGVLGSVTASQYNIGADQILAAPGANVFVGIGAGRNNTGSNNAFFGYSAAGGGNSGSYNAAFGVAAGGSNVTGGDNSFFGTFAGVNNITGSGNAYFGNKAGLANNGSQNAFFGDSAGEDFVGGNNNTLLGADTAATAGISNATAIGSHAFVSKSNSLVLGSIASINGGANVNVGIGTTEPNAKLEVAGDVYISGQGSALILRDTGGHSCARLVINSQLQILVSSVNCPGGN